jgi:hypothetical protein
MIDVRVKGRSLRQASTVRLRRHADNAVFHISAPCILRLPDGLIHVIGEPNEELNTGVWDIREKFEVLGLSAPGPTQRGRR